MVELSAVDVADALVVCPPVTAEPARGVLVRDPDDEVALVLPLVHLVAGESIHEGIGSIASEDEVDAYMLWHGELVEVSSSTVWLAL